MDLSTTAAWRIPQSYPVMVGLHELHENAEELPDPSRFDPQRFIDGKPNTSAWVPFGGRTRRCVGAAFANMDVDVAPRKILRIATIGTTDEPGEKSQNRRVAA